MLVTTLTALAVALLLALTVIAVVAISSGQLKPKGERLAKVADRTTEHLNAQGSTPQFLERLDASRTPDPAPEQETVPAQ